MKKIFDFLRKLKKNNRKEWFDAHKDEYLIVKAEFEAFGEKVLKAVKKFDPAIHHDLEVKNCTFRIYRDVRFSKNKQPYKNNMALDINPGGRKSGLAGYYLHLEPGNSFVAGGVWMPEPETLQAIRQEIDYNPGPLLKTLASAPFKKFYKGLDEEDKMKTSPKGFDKDHPQIELLKNRHFLVSAPLSDAQAFGPKAVDTIVLRFRAMKPFLAYLREAQGMGEKS